MKNLPTLKSSFYHKTFINATVNVDYRDHCCIEAIYYGITSTALKLLMAFT